ncbi:MAG: DUF421 domain-containing protein [Firmicutes bacterium]|nr:DUF421 domain-containing protein [Bacillota bacterium]
MNDYLIVLFRIFTLFPAMYLMTVLMGKRSIGELPIFDFLVAITIGSVVGADIADPSIRHGPTFAAVIAIALFQISFTWLKVKLPIVRDWSTLTPTVVVANGTFLMHNIARIRYTVNDLLSMLRQKDIFQLSEIQYAIVEPSGQLSVLKKTEATPPSARDMGLKVPAKGLPTLLIVDGERVPGALEQIGRSERWLNSLLQKQGHGKIEDVYLAALESDGTLYTTAKRQVSTGESIYY